MYRFIAFFSEMWVSLFQLLGRYRFDLGGTSFSLLSILFGFLLLGILVNVFWKGGKA